jgi:hypothetical protein
MRSDRLHIGYFFRMVKPVSLWPMNVDDWSFHFPFTHNMARSRYVSFILLMIHSKIQQLLLSTKYGSDSAPEPEPKPHHSSGARASAVIIIICSIFFLLTTTNTDILLSAQKFCLRDSLTKILHTLLYQSKAWKFLHLTLI